MPTTGSSLNFTEEIETSVVGDTLTPPPVGSLRLFSNDGVWYAQDSAGVVTALAGVTDVTAADGTVVVTVLGDTRTVRRAAISGDVTINAGSNIATFTVDMATQAELDAAIAGVTTLINDHIADPTAAHAATAISNTPAGNIAATTVQAALNELDTEKVPNTRNINAGAGLAGGGDLSDDRTIDLASAAGTLTITANNTEVTYGTTANTAAQGNDSRIVNAVPNTRQVIAGAGLVGGGALSGDVTLDVAANADGSIVVAANDVRVGVLATDAQHGNRGGGALHANATTSVAGFMSAADKIRNGQALDAQADLGFVGDLVTTAGSITGGTTLLTCASAPFVVGDVGKRVTIPGAGASNAQFTGTIASFVSATQVNVNTAVTNTVNTGISFGTDNTAAINAMMTLVNTTFALTPGTKIVFGRSATNSYGFPIPVVFNKTVQIEGIGGGYTADTGDYVQVGGTRLAWWGTSNDGGTAFGAFFTFSPTGVQSLKRVSFRSCWLDCRNNDQNQALIGLKLASCQGWSIDDFFVMDAMAIGIWFDIASSPTEARDCTRGMMQNTEFRCLDNTAFPTVPTLTPTTTSSAVNLSTPQSLTLAAANGLTASGYVWVQTNIGKPTLVRYTGGGGTTTLTGAQCSAEDVPEAPTTVSGSNVVQCSPSNSSAMYLNGGTGANTCCNTFVQIAVSHGTTWGPAAVDFGTSDSNEFINLYVNGGNRTADGAINRQRKPGIRMNGSNTSLSLASRNNTFRGGDPGSLPTTSGGAAFMALLNTGARMLAPSGPSYWNLYQLGNGAPMPEIEAGAHLIWDTNGGVNRGGATRVAVADQAVAAATLTGLTGSGIVVPPQGFQVGTAFKWTVIGTAGAAGTAANVIHVRIGANGTTADGVVLTFTTAVGTAAASTFRIDISATIRTIGGAATLVGVARVSNSATTGFINVLQQVLVGTPATFNSVTSGLLYATLSVQTGAAKTLNITQCMAEVVNPAN